MKRDALRIQGLPLLVRLQDFGAVLKLQFEKPASPAGLLAQWTVPSAVFASLDQTLGRPYKRLTEQEVPGSQE